MPPAAVALLFFDILKQTLLCIVAFVYYMKCDHCGTEIQPAKFRQYTGGLHDIVKDTVPLPFTCNRCGGSFCSDCRLPENHDCDGIPISGGFKECVPHKKSPVSSNPSQVHPKNCIRVFSPGYFIKNGLKLLPIVFLLFIIYMFLKAT